MGVRLTTEPVSPDVLVPPRGPGVPPVTSLVSPKPNSGGGCTAGLGSAALLALLLLALRRRRQGAARPMMDFEHVCSGLSVPQRLDFVKGQAGRLRDLGGRKPHPQQVPRGIGPAFCPAFGLPFGQSSLLTTY